MGLSSRGVCEVFGSESYFRAVRVGFFGLFLRDAFQFVSSFLIKILSLLDLFVIKLRCSKY